MVWKWGTTDESHLYVINVLYHLTKFYPFPSEADFLKLPFLCIDNSLKTEPFLTVSLMTEIQLTNK